MIVILGGVQAQVRIDMTMPKKPEESNSYQDISPWEREAYGEGGRFGSMTGIPSGDPTKDKIGVTFAGCGYRTAKYMAEAGKNVRFISVVGDDPLGMAARADLERSGVDTSDMISVDAMTSIRITAFNFLGDIEFARVDEGIFSELNRERISQKAQVIRDADMVFADGNMPVDALTEIGRICEEEKIDYYFDPASIEGAERGAEALEGFTGIMPGRREAEVMSGLEILSGDQMAEAGKYFQSKGIHKVMITIKGGGIYYKAGSSEGVIRPEKVLRFAETSGAGDVMAAAMLLAFAEGKPMEKAADDGMSAAADFLSDVKDERKY